MMKDLTRKALSRRSFLAGAGTVAAATAVGCNTATAPTATTPPVVPTGGTQPTYSDIDILNFALNLEYVEAEYYLRAATGAGLSAADAGTGAGTVVAPAVTKLAGLTARQQEYVNIIAQDELNHVRFLRSALGGMAVSRPNLDLMNSFNSLAAAATVGLATPMTTFNPFANFNNWLIGGFIFEDVGVTAYHGAAGQLSAKSPYLTPSAQILAVEAYHASTLRTLIAGTALPTPDTFTGTATTPTAPVTTYVQLANAIATFRAAVSGGTSVAAGDETLLSTGVTYAAAVPAAGTTPATPVIVTAGASTIVPLDANAIAYARTFDQVLHIVYGTAAGPTSYGFGVTSGAFFPSGLNGNITKTYS